MTNINEILGINPNENSLSAFDMFVENNPHGYLKKANLRPYLVSVGKARPSDLPKLETTIENFNKGVKIVNLICKQGEPGKEFTWLRLGIGSKPIPVQIWLVDRLLDFFNDYQSDIIKPNFTLTELLIEAEK